MNFNQEKILEVLDRCAENFTFPALDNGYVYLAATRMSIYRSNEDWGIVIEVFGFSPRSGTPDIFIYTFSSNIVNRNPKDNYVSGDAYANYINNNPHNESAFVYPIDNDEWQSEDDLEYTISGTSCSLRGMPIRLPENGEYRECGIELEDDTPLTYEFCRYLSAKYRNQILCTDEERRINLAPDMKLLCVLDEWRHPDIIEGELPSQVETFKQLAEVLVSGDTGRYNPANPPNTHWVNWPDGGSL